MTSVPTQRAEDLHISTSTSDVNHEHEQTWDAVETYFECITTCSLDDGECITRCVEQLRDTDD
ncbi:hypothetical protein [Prochlorococcus sp. MIT 1303]|uniref:hypothetical protein n=1 Tax=Prochlorococcus sp. MIT 1303 TaxID=1723647 RepID=UPI0007BB4791|nr:hypothetical protein [Prochlorococcus sp. MIT 1303]KZR67894.1 hypothetical protein PMIT1303_00307 [Prochlorococcus sp. MIT 1303]